MEEKPEPSKEAVEQPSNEPSKDGRERRLKNLVPGAKAGQGRGPDGKMLPVHKATEDVEAGQAGVVVGAAAPASGRPPHDPGITRLVAWYTELLAELKEKKCEKP